MYNLNAVVHNIGVCAGDKKMSYLLAEKAF